ncbi:MAG: RICIN domain-containing protein [Oscillospiraceae bacterium]|nr:RICIN domain-containing protein [Oscillospiraceae bacterium]
MKRLLCVILALTMLASVPGIVFADDLSVTLNGQPLDTGVELIVRNETVFFPVNTLFTAMNYAVSWDGETATLTATAGVNELRLVVGESVVHKNGVPKSIDGEIFNGYGYIYVPLSALTAMGMGVEQNGNSVAITADMMDGRYFKIVHTATGKALSIDGNSGNDGWRVRFVNQDAVDIQLWSLSARRDGSYLFVNKKTRRSFDMPNGRLDLGLELIQYGVTDGTNQWVKPVRQDDGTYLMQCMHGDNLYLTVMPGNFVAQQEYIGDASQKFTFIEFKADPPVVSDTSAAVAEPDPLNGTFASLVTEDISVLTVENGMLALTEAEAKDENVWKLILQGTGVYKITNKKTGDEAILRITENGAAVDGLDGTVFAVTAPLMAPEIYTKDSFGGKYYRISVAGSDQAVSVADESENNGARIVTAAASASEFQSWAFIPQGNNMYTITNRASGRSFDVPSASVEEGAWITQYTTNNGANQIFEVVDGAGGTVMFKNKNSEQYLTIEDGYIVQRKRGRSNDQYFTLTEDGESDLTLIGAAPTLFALKGEDKVNNVKLQWNSVGGVDHYDVYRRTDDYAYEFVTSLSGNTIDDYDLEVGKSYSYAIYALSDTGLIDYVETKAVIPYDLPADLKSSTNLAESGFDRPNTLYVDGVYYRFSEWGGGQEWRLMMTTSTDDITYSEPVEVLNAAEILAHETCQGFQSARFESQNFVYNPVKNKFAFIAHFEADGGYGTARTSIATATPGERFTFYGAYRPDGGDTRDLNVYVDDDYSAYVIAAINMNADLALYKLNEDWSGFEGFVCFVNRNSHRELPGMLKVDGRYYLFTSGTAGWFPTQGMYNTATSIEGPWSELRVVGNTTTFSSQSGTVSRLKPGSENFMMNTYRWMYFWDAAVVKRTNNRRYPISVSNGFAFYDFYDELLYNWDNDYLIPVQNGRILSQDMPSVGVSAGRTTDGSFANDGNYQSRWDADLEGLEPEVEIITDPNTGETTEKTKPLGWPYSWTVDLGENRELNEIQISWLIWNGSEPYYSYKIEVSGDGEHFTTALDNTEGFTDYGFTVDRLNAAGRYVRLTVIDAKPRSHPNENNYPPQLYEVKILGK